MGEQQVAELSSQVVIARAQTAEARARLDRIQTVLRADSPNAAVDAMVTDTLKNDVITKLREPVQEECATAQDKGRRSSGAEQYRSMAGSA